MTIPVLMVYLDDERATPPLWTRASTVEETIALLETRAVVALSLDNDLGEGLQEGYKVLDWLEETVYNDVTFPLPRISVHSANSSRVEYMKRAIASIERIRRQQINAARKRENGSLLF